MRLIRRRTLSAYNPNNKIRLVRGGKEYFDALEQLIDTSEKTLHLQTYIYTEDETGKRIAEALVRAAKRNVKVYVLLDGYASKPLSETFIRRLTSSGIQFRFFEPLFDSRTFYFGRRLHHKVVVADEKSALVGGMNISDRYNDINGTPAWLDFAVVVEGQAAITLNKICGKLWRGKLRGRKLPNEEKKIIFKKEHNNHSSVRVRRNDWVRGRNEISASYIEMFNSSRERIIIMSSYFIPGNIFRLRMRAALKRGVKIKVVLAGISDVKLAKYAERYFYAWMLRHNVEIYEYQKSVLHAKLSICDSNFATIGSYNVNQLSAFASVELNLDIKSESFVNQVSRVLTNIIENDCVPVTKEKYEKQKNSFGLFISWCAYNIVRMLLFLFTFNLKQEKEKP